MLARAVTAWLNETAFAPRMSRLDDESFTGSIGMAQIFPKSVAELLAIDANRTKAESYVLDIARSVTFALLVISRRLHIGPLSSIMPNKEVVGRLSRRPPDLGPNGRP